MVIALYIIFSKALEINRPIISKFVTISLWRNLFLKSKNLRPFIITRSSTLGSNKYGFHWTGDNYANFDFLRGSIADNFLNQMWGFQMVGPDICGFGGNTTE